MSEITLQQIEEQHSKLTTMIAAFKAQAATEISIPAGTIKLRDGERYAGIVIENGKPSHHLILLPAKPTGRLDWKEAMAWAEDVDGALPSRFEAALLYANLRDEFDQSAYHWTSTQFSGDYAWIQYFGCGNQDYDGKSGEFLARAVRRLTI